MITTTIRRSLSRRAGAATLMTAYAETIREHQVFREIFGTT